MSETPPLAAPEAAPVAVLVSVPTRPCGYCGRPVPQRATAGRPYRYCRDNDDECLRAARNARMRQRNAPGLAGHVAQAFEVVDRLERAADTLAEALHAELSPAGVERQVTAVRADSAAQVAAAHAERDEARRDAETARVLSQTAAMELQQVRTESAAAVESALGEAEAARELAAKAVALADERVAAAQAQQAAATLAAEQAEQRTARARDERDEARRAAATAAALQAEAQRERDSAREAAASAAAARDAAKAEGDRQAALAAEATRRAEASIAEAKRQAQASAAELAEARQEAELAVAEIRAQARQREEELTAAVTEARDALRVAERSAVDLSLRLAAVEADRDAARRDGTTAQEHAARLGERVGQLAVALARLEPRAPVVGEDARAG